MKAFIRKHEYNYIKKCTQNLNNALRTCVDINIIAAAKAYMNDKIFKLFTDPTEEEKELLDISRITDPLHIERYLTDLYEYVYGMPKLTNAQINRLFKKEKKLKLPNISLQDSKNVYLGWVDNSIRKLFVAYDMGGKLLGMACNLQSIASGHTHMCVLCNHIGGENEVAFVSSICKTDNTGEGTYRSIGFDICIDSVKCNERIASIEKLESILKDVNNIK